MRAKLLSIFVRWYRKWVLAECRHICAFCKFKKQCYHEDDWWLDLNTLGYYDIDNYGDCKQDKELQ